MSQPYVKLYIAVTVGFFKPLLTTDLRESSLSATMPLASVDEWRARIGSSWCALGRPVKSRRPRYREYRYGSPPPGGGKRVKLQDDGSVSAILMFILMVVAMMTLWSLILNGYSPICTSKLSVCVWVGGGGGGA